MARNTLYIKKQYYDSMAIVRELGRPDIFVTMTCNPNYREIKENLFPYQQPYDRPDLVARIFKLKVDELLHDLTKKHVNFFLTTLYEKKLPHLRYLVY